MVEYPMKPISELLKKNRAGALAHCLQHHLRLLVIFFYIQACWAAFFDN
jgi:hypothetical protein